VYTVYAPWSIRRARCYLLITSKTSLVAASSAVVPVSADQSMWKPPPHHHRPESREGAFLPLPTSPTLTPMICSVSVKRWWYRLLVECLSPQ
jgi:hypothetical protein